LKKMHNTYLNHLSYKRRKPDVLGYPTSLMIEPTNNCNLKCPLCPTGCSLLKRKKEFMSFDLFKKIIDEVGPYLYNLSMWHYGEPTLHPDLYKFVRYAKDLGVDYVKISTNGHFFRTDEKVKEMIESGLDNAMVCMDGASQETLDKYRSGSSFDIVVEGMKRITRIKKETNSEKPELELQFIVMKHNEGEIPEIRKIAHDVGANILTIRACDADLNFDEIRKKSVNFVPDDNNHPFFKKGDEGNVKTKKEVPNYCHALWTSSVVTCGGKVVPCCYDPDEKLVMGDMKESSFGEIWHGEKYINLRKQVLKDRKSISLCANCTEGVSEETNYSSERID